EEGRTAFEGPLKKISIRKIAVSKFDITRGQWAAFVKATNRPTIGGCAWSGFSDSTRKPWEGNPDASWQHLGFPQDDNHPVV
uniref:SUMF1/EgtB/PvdO family nonheme iron enzyme n=1 Tax=Enterobacter hormaechei TaxID=158836 RepID=UPI0013D13600